MQDKKIGFVGLGRMGANMARCLKDKGYTISVVYDLQRPVADSLAAELGAESVETLAAVTAGADIIFTVVTNDAAMEAIFRGEDNLFCAAEGRLFLNCATLTPAVHRQLEQDALAAGAACLEACMASSIPQARQGELFLMIGGKREDFDASRGAAG
jgi:3-hydroxyisobutyrate dehydrogenase